MIYPPVPKAEVNIVAFDLDGTLAENTWPSSEIGEPISEGLEMLQHYSSLGNAIIIYTSRPHSHEQNIWWWLEEQGVSHLVYDVVCGKPLAVLYVDDRAFRFERKVKTEIYVHADDCSITKEGVCVCR